MTCSSLVDKPAGFTDLADGQGFSPLYPHQCLIFVISCHQYYTLCRCLQCCKTQRNPFRGRLRRIVNRHHRTPVIDGRISRKKTGRMPVLAHAEYDNIKPAARLDDRLIHICCPLRPQLCRYSVQVSRRRINP